MACQSSHVMRPRAALVARRKRSDAVTGEVDGVKDYEHALRWRQVVQQIDEMGELAVVVVARPARSARLSDASAEHRAIVQQRSSRDAPCALVPRPIAYGRRREGKALPLLDAEQRC